MNKKEQIRLGLLLGGGAVTMPFGILGWIGVVCYMYATYLLLDHYQSGMNTIVKIIVAVVGGGILGVATTALIYLFLSV